MAGPVPAIHVFGSTRIFKTWMPATSAGMTSQRKWLANRSCEAASAFAEASADNLRRFAAQVGAGDGNRTHDTQLGKLMFYH